MTTHKLILRGGPPDSLRVPASVLMDALAALVDGARLATRFAVEGESMRKGSRPAWLEAACDLAVTGLTAGSAVIAVDAKPLQEIDPGRFGAGRQRGLFDEAGAGLGELTAVDVFGRVLASLLDERDGAEILADRPLLDGCARFARAASGPYTGLRLEGIARRDRPIEVSALDVPRIERLRDATPRSHAVRVAGILDTVSASRADVVLALADGGRIPARLDQHALEPLRALLGSEVVVSGLAHYRASGRLSVLDVESLEPARPEDAIFRSAPAPRRHRLVVEPGSSEGQGVAASFFGTWPGDESDEELLASLRSLG